ncbi:hypothetical protein CCAX7_61310 [Capsulimonas corticalis]|uniref:Uncharacterized protein n=1 Tax=Capsulimonas corticalis TaxID=2219043 RepID=A0A402CWC5_9BACT|nr:hypothetical protein [Capsulimonas corticalis]BDI34080.1 hypothetical protein CCAX7_61310 [Capsulimonas corticalis]
MDDGQPLSFLKSPLDALSAPGVAAPTARLRQGPSPQLHGRLAAASAVCAALVVVAGLIVWLWGYPSQKDNPGFWHVSLVSLLFWISVTQGMAAISAILRIFHASWRFPLNRLMDFSSLFGLWACALLPFLVAARDQIYALGAAKYQNNVWRMAGPTFYDCLAIGAAYIAGWALLYLTALPDFAALRDKSEPGGNRRRLYSRLAMSWIGAREQWNRLRMAEGILVVGVLAAFVGSQTVLGWDFQLAAARNWDSSIFAPLYTLGSLLGGLALSVLVITVAGRVLPGSSLFTTDQYDNLGRFMIALGMVWFYFRWCDYLTAWYGKIPVEWALQNNRVAAFPILAGIMTFGCFFAPVFGGMFRAIRTSAWGLCAVSTCVLAGLAVERYLDTVPTFAPNYPLSALTPTAASSVVFLGISAMFVLTYLIAARYVPIVSRWGMAKSRMRTSEFEMGGVRLTVMLEEAPIWKA